MLPHTENKYGTKCIYLYINKEINEILIKLSSNHLQFDILNDVKINKSGKTLFLPYRNIPSTHFTKINSTLLYFSFIVKGANNRYNCIIYCYR